MDLYNQYSFHRVAMKSKVHEVDKVMVKIENETKSRGLGPTSLMPVLSQDWQPSRVGLVKVDVSPWEKSDKFCYVLHNVLSKEECQQLVDFSESEGYSPALVNVGGGKQRLETDIRNNERCIFDDHGATEQIWQRVVRSLAAKDEKVLQELMSAPWVNQRTRKLGKCEKRLSAVGLNERMRFLRYDPGTYFARHFDGSYVRDTEAGLERKGEQSYVTFQLYLNEGFDGGATRFMDPWEEESAANGSLRSIFKFKKTGTDVVPRTGSILLFQHDCCHEGSLLKSGRKYCIRSDVMYSTEGEGCEYSNRPIIARQHDYY